MFKREYFAYGSNLNFRQMHERCPDAEAVTQASLVGCELAFRHGSLTILPKEGSLVEGQIWSITEQDERLLDRYEGYPEFYGKEIVTVTDAEDTPHEVMVYTMNEPYRSQITPISPGYIQVVRQGCRDAGISEKAFLAAAEHCNRECRKKSTQIHRRKDKTSQER